MVPHCPTKKEILTPPKTNGTRNAALEKGTPAQKNVAILGTLQ